MVSPLILIKTLFPFTRIKYSNHSLSLTKVRTRPQRRKGCRFSFFHSDVYSIFGIRILCAANHCPCTECENKSTVDDRVTIDLSLEFEIFQPWNRFVKQVSPGSSSYKDVSIKNGKGPIILRSISPSNIETQGPCLLGYSISRPAPKEEFVDSSFPFSELELFFLDTKTCSQDHASNPRPFDFGLRITDSASSCRPSLVKPPLNFFRPKVGPRCR